jgi:putative acetyltransferase
MIIRAATSADFSAIDEIIKRAFSYSAMGYHGEAELVRRLYNDGAVAASLVAEHGAQVIGHIMFSVMAVEADGCRLKAAGLAPIAVDPGSQGKGVGAALITAGLNRLTADGFQISFVLGHAAYYPRFGYSAALAAPYVSRYAGTHFMAVHLDSELALPQRGKADYAPAFA